MKLIPDIGTRKKRIKQLIVLIAIFYFLIGMPLILLNFASWDQCEESNSIRELSFKGVVTKKTLDKENKYQQLVKIKDSDKIKTLNLSNEILKLKKTGNSITWERLTKNDSIIKKIGTFEISYKNKDSNNWNTLEMAFPDCE